MKYYNPRLTSIQFWITLWSGFANPSLSRRSSNSFLNSAVSLGYGQSAIFVGYEQRRLELGVTLSPKENSDFADF